MTTYSVVVDAVADVIIGILSMAEFVGIGMVLMLESGNYIQMIVMELVLVLDKSLDDNKKNDTVEDLD